MHHTSQIIQKQNKSKKNLKMSNEELSRVFRTPTTPIIQQFLHIFSPKLAILWRQWKDKRKWRRTERELEKDLKEYEQRKMRWVLFGETESSKAIQDFCTDYPSGRC